MASPHSTSLRALRLLSQQHKTTPTPSLRRTLHITGAQYSAPLKTGTQKPTSLYASHTLADLKAECRKRALRGGGGKPELIERLSTHDGLQSRAFSIAMKRITQTTTPPDNANEHATRPFTTTRSLNDASASPVDLIYMPSMTDLHTSTPTLGPRIPILPQNHSYASPADVDGEEAVDPQPLKPQVYTVSSEVSASVSPMREVVDNEAVEIDPFSLAEEVGRSEAEFELGARDLGSRKGGIVREVWDGFVEDVLGPRKRKGSRIV